MIRLLIADDHNVVRQGLKQILADYADMVVDAEATNGTEVIHYIRRQAFDVLILDMSMPGRSGIELIKQIKLEKPRLPILIFSVHEELQYAVRSLKAGAAGYLTKNGEAKELTLAIRKLAADGLYFTPTVLEKLAEEAVSPKNGLPHERLTDREFQIFEMLVTGKTVTDIANDLCLSVKTVSTHKHHILEKMGLANCAELICYALANNLGSAVIS
jgi:DNA-binding NarL/FixJ family response regulator